MGTGKTYSTKYLLDSNNSSGVAGQVLSTTSTGIDWVDANTVPGSGLWLEIGNDIYNSNSGNVGIGTTTPDTKTHIQGASAVTGAFYDGSTVLTVEDTNPYIQIIGTDGGNQASSLILTNVPAAGTGDNKNWAVQHRGTTQNGNFGISYDTTSASGQDSADGTDLFVIETTGNIGIGEISPDRKLVLDGLLGTAALEIKKESDRIVYLGTGTGAAGSDDTLMLLYHDDVIKVNVSTIGDSYFNGGNVGIGTTSPNYKFEVQGVISSADAGLQKATFANVGNDLVLTANADATNVTAKMLFNSSGAGGAGVSTKMIIDGSGNVGIGTTTPQKKVHIEGTGGASEMQILVSSASDTVGHTAGIGLRGEGGEADGDLRIKGGIFFERIAGSFGNGKMILAVNSSVSNTSVTVADHALTIDTNKNVGIGTDSPDAKLDVFSAASFRADVATGNPLISIVNNTATSNTAGTATIKFTQGNTQAGGKIVSARDGNYSSGATRTSNLQFYTSSAANDTEKMRIDSNGSVGINKTTSLGSHGLSILKGASNQQLGCYYNETNSAAFGARSNGDVQIYGYNGASLTNILLGVDGSAVGGNVGIGVISPTAKLQIHNTNAGAAAVAAFLVNASTTVDTETRLAFAAHTNDDIATGRYSYISTVNTSGSNGQAMTFATNQTGASAIERMRITSGGSVGILTDDPVTYYKGLTISGGGGAPFISFNTETQRNLGQFTRIVSDTLGINFFTSATGGLSPDTHFSSMTLCLKNGGTGIGGLVGIGTTSPVAKLDVDGNITTPTQELSNTATPTNFGVYSSEIRLIDTPNGGLKQCRVITDNYGEWILVGRFAANAMTTVQSTWSSESGLDTSTAQNNVTRFSADFGDSYPTEVRIMGATNFNKWRDTRTVDFVYGVPEGRQWKFFFSGGATNGMDFSTKWGWGVNGAYDGFGRWVNPAQTFVRMSDANVTNPSAAYTTATVDAFNWNGASDAKITVSSFRAYSGQDTTVTSGFGIDDANEGFFDVYPSETNNMQGGTAFSSAVWVLIKLPNANSGGGSGGNNLWSANGTNIYNTNLDNVGIGTDSPGTAKLFVQNPNASTNPVFQTKLDTAYGMGMTNQWVSQYVSKIQLGRLGGTVSNIDFIYDIAGTEYGSIKRNYIVSSLKFERGTTLDMIIDGTGNVGIGTTSPTGKLTVSDAGGTGLEIYPQDSNTRVVLSAYDRIDNAYRELNYDAYNHSWEIQDSSKMVLINNGNVGIGITGPTKKLDVIDTINGAYGTSTQQTVARFFNKANDATINSAFINLQCSSDNEASNPVAAIGVVSEGTSSNNGSFVAATRSSGGIIERLRINSAGAVKFNAYGAGTLVTDASGNITVSSGGGTGGPFLPLAGGTMTGTSGIEFPENFKLKWKDSSTSTEVFNIYSAGGTNFINSGDGTNSVKTKIVVGDGGLDINSNDPSQGIANFSIGGMGVAGTSHSFTSGSGANGSCVVVIQADTDNTVENSNPILKLTQDGGTLEAIFGINGDANNTFTGALGNAGYLKSNADLQVAPGNLLSTTFLQNGNVGIGTNNPLHALEVYGAARNIAITNTTEDDAGIVFRDAQAATDQAAAIKFNSSDNKLKFFVNDEVAQRMVIDTSGNVGINKTSPAVKLDVSDSIAGAGFTGGLARFENTIETSSGGAGVLNIANNYQGGFGTLIKFFFEESSVATINFNSSTNAVVYNTTSDYRLKEDLQQFNGLEIVDQIKTYNYKWKKADARGYGALAHELQEVFPDAVTGEKDGEDMQGVDYSTLVPVLIKSIQELKAEIELLKQQINN